MSGQRIGYKRVSTHEQNEDRQLEGIELDKVFVDKASGKDTQRVGYQNMLAFVREGDHIYIHSMDRLARNLDDLRKTVRYFIDKKIEVTFIKEQLTFNNNDSPMSNLLLSVMGAFAEFERALIRERQREGIELAKKRGVYKGRQKSLTEQQVQELKKRVSDSENKTKLASEYGISRQTLYTYLNE